MSATAIAAPSATIEINDAAGRVQEREALSSGENPDTACTKSGPASTSGLAMTADIMTHLSADQDPDLLAQTEIKGSRSRCAFTRAVPNEAEMLASLLPLVRHIARTFATSNGSTHKSAEFESDANFAALRAIRTFDCRHGLALSTWTKFVVRRALYNTLRANDPVNERARARIRGGHLAEDRLRVQLGRDPTIDELEAAVPGYSDALLAAKQHAVEPLLDDVRALSSDHTEDDVIAKLSADALKAACRHLRPRLQELVQRHYFERIPLRALAEPMRVSPQRMSALHRDGACELARNHHQKSELA